jgi:hypothetical protein
VKTEEDPETGSGDEEKKSRKDAGLAYFTINEFPPWYMCILFGFQVSNDKLYTTWEGKQPHGKKDGSEKNSMTFCVCRYIIRRGALPRQKQTVL